MLLVHDHEPEAAHRREHRGTRADDDARLAARDPVALVPPLGVAESRVQDRHGVAEPLPEAADRLWGERDLGHEHDRPETAFEHGRACLQVDLGLAAPRRPDEEQVLAEPFVEGCGDPRHRRHLLVRQLLGLDLALDGLAARGRRTLPRGARRTGATSSSARAGVEP